MYMYNHVCLSLIKRKIKCFYLVNQRRVFLVFNKELGENFRTFKNFDPKYTQVLITSISILKTRTIIFLITSG